MAVKYDIDNLVNILKTHPEKRNYFEMKYILRKKVDPIINQMNDQRAIIGFKEFNDEIVGFEMRVPRTFSDIFSIRYSSLVLSAV